MKNRLLTLYKKLLEKYGHQGWWPVFGKYHPGDYSRPADRSERFEVVAGAILTQNTNWRNADKALENLKKENLLDPKKIAGKKESKIAEHIRSSGYYKQKAKRLKEAALHFLIADAIPMDGEEMRKSWLSIKGVGPETADSILLYAYGIPVFVIDAYTKRFVKANKLTSKQNYEELREFFETNLKSENREKDVALFREYHALIVAWGKEKNISTASRRKGKS